MNVVNEVFINNILSGFGTHAINIASNSFNLAYLPFERAVGGAITGSTREAEAGIRQYAEMRSTVFDSLRMMGRTFASESPVLDSQVKLDMQTEGQQAISSGTFNLEENTVAGAIVNGIGHAQRMPSRFLMTADEMFKQVTFRSRLRANLIVEGRRMTPDQLQSAGYDSPAAFVDGEFERAFITTERLDDAWQDLVQRGRVEDTPEVKERFIRENLGSANEGSNWANDALRTAREATFTQKLEEGSISQSFQQMANRHPFLRQITPFIQTPINLLSKSFHRVPLVNLAFPLYRKRLGSTDPAIRAQAAGEMATGAALATGTLFMALENRITGGGPTDPDKRAEWIREGWQPYSFNVGTDESPRWVQFGRMDPFVLSLGIAGDMAEAIKAGEGDPSIDMGGWFAMLSAAATNNVTSKSWLQGISDAAELLNGDQQAGSRWERFLQGRAAAMVPYSSAGNQFNRVNVDHAREARGWVDMMKSRVPGLSESLPVRHDWLTGQPQDNPQRLLGFLQYGDETNDPVAGELRRLNYGFHGPDRRIGNVTLNSEQFQDWNRIMGTIKNPNGRTLYQELEQAIQSDRYDPDRERVPDGITAPSESHRVRVVSRVISAFKQYSRRQLFEEHPDLWEAYQAYERYEGQARQGNIPDQMRDNLLLEF